MNARYEYQEIPLDKIQPYSLRGYGNVEVKVLLWLVILADPRNWRGSVTARRRSDGMYELLAGHHRFEAIRRLGWKTMSLEIGEFTDLEAHEIYVKDNSLDFAPTAGMAIGSAPAAVALYVAQGMVRSLAMDEVRKNYGLTQKTDVPYLLAMHEALKTGELTEKIRDVLSIPAATAFWGTMLRWQKTFNQPLSVAAQNECINLANPKDIVRDLPRKLSDAKKKKLKDTAIKTPTITLPAPARTMDEDLLALGKQAQKFETKWKDNLEEQVSASLVPWIQECFKNVVIVAEGADDAETDIEDGIAINCDAAD